jgi:hypothetical protein
MRRLPWILALAGCASGPAHPTQPPGAPPTPASVTRADPGGDAADPHAAALQRLLAGPWGQRSDKDDQLLVPLPDAENWKRVRYWGVDHFVGFRYGSDHHAIVVAFVQDNDEERPSSETCLHRFEGWGRPQIQAYDVDFDPFQAHHSKFRERPLIALTVDGEVSLGLSRPQFSAAWAAYAVYPRACLILSMAAPWRSAPELAQRVRDRFVAEGFALLDARTETRPYRK